MKLTRDRDLIVVCILATAVILYLLAHLIP